MPHRTFSVAAGRLADREFGLSATEFRGLPNIYFVIVFAGLAFALIRGHIRWGPRG
jgi:hypothetical protein